jgi:hypothetical protein
MELIVKVDESKAKQLIGFLKTLEYVEIKRPSKKKPAREPRFEYFGSDPNWQPDATELRKLSSRKKAEW